MCGAGKIVAESRHETHDTGCESIESRIIGNDFCLLQGRRCRSIKREGALFKKLLESYLVSSGNYERTLDGCKLCCLLCVLYAVMLMLLVSRTRIAVSKQQQQAGSQKGCLFPMRSCAIF